MSLPETPANHEGRARSRSDFTAKTVLLSAGTLLSRLLGLIREQLLGFTLGAGPQAEAYLIAFRIPNLLRDLFAEGALSAAFIPAYSRADHESPQRGFDLARRLLTLLAIVLTMLCSLGILLAPLLVEAIAPGFLGIKGKSDLSIQLTRVMMPILPFISFAAVAMGMLNSRDRFTMPAIAPAIFNLVNIVVVTILHALGLNPEQIAYGWAAGSLIGSAAQFLIQWPALRGEGFSFRPDFRFDDPLIREILYTMAPATLSLAAVQINIFVSTNFTSTQPGAVAWLGYAFRLLYLPMGLFGVAVGTVAGARLSRLIAMGDAAEAHGQIAQALRLLVFLTLPSALGLIFAGGPIVRLIYERGAFTAGDTSAVATALAWMSIGLVAYASTKVFVPYFYAVRQPRIPVTASLLAVGANLATLSLLFDTMGFKAAGLGMALGNLTNGGFLLMMYRGPESLLRRLDLRFLLSLSFASALMCLVVLGAMAGVGQEGAGLPHRLMGALVPVFLGAGTYLGLAVLLRVPEATRVMGLVRQRLAR
ncbi:MAG: murein biosynthesis integral membrane protein MurJ [Vicinamibacteria bacterium]|nr:murein biosynthesis integral membrane protein MurJ [Vicinamibacteria bacterium]